MTFIIDFYTIVHVCIYIYTYIYTHIYIYTHTHTHTHTYIYMRLILHQQVSFYLCYDMYYYIVLLHDLLLTMSSNLST